MSLQGYRPEERGTLVDVLAELTHEDAGVLKMRDSLWKSFESFEQKGAFSMTFDADEIVLRVKDDPEPLTLPRGREFAQVCNDRDSPERVRLDAMLRTLWSPPRPPARVAEVVPLKLKQ
jgi:hypothetical protein